MLTDQKLVMDRALNIFSNAKNGIDILGGDDSSPGIRPISRGKERGRSILRHKEERRTPEDTHQD